MVMAAAGLRMVERAPTVVPAILAIRAIAEEQTLPRITGLFAQFGIVPTMISSRRVDDLLLIDVQFESEQADRVELLSEKLRAMVAVQRAIRVVGA